MGKSRFPVHFGVFSPPLQYRQNCLMSFTEQAFCPVAILCSGQFVVGQLAGEMPVCSLHSKQFFLIAALGFISIQPPTVYCVPMP